MACDKAVAAAGELGAASGERSRRVMRVSSSAIASARAQVAISELLGRPVSETVRRIAAVPTLPERRAIEEASGRRVIRVSSSAIASARAQVAISELLGRPVSETVRRIAGIR